MNRQSIQRLYIYQTNELRMQIQIQATDLVDQYIFYLFKRIICLFRPH